MEYATHWHVLATLAVVVILGLSAYALHLYVRLQQLPAKSADHDATGTAAAEAEAEAPVHCATHEARDEELRQSISLLARAMVNGDCNLSEGCIRIRYLMDHLDPAQVTRAGIDIIYVHYEAIAHLDVLEARKALDKAARRAQDREREALEAKHGEAILLAARELMQRFGESLRRATS
ncbi:MAG: DUF2489 domain-containing protein [Moraxellaceae bacterium]|nr:DUF2489 domain-containing protein [Moraxellaceae bacterium]